MATIVQKVLFKNTTTEVIYDLYMNAKTHAILTDGPVEITEKIGSNFKAFGGSITGKNLQLVKDRLIVQSWRGSDWDTKDSDSAFVVSLEQKGKDVLLQMFHANVPEDKAQAIDRGWYDYYWNPWKQYLVGQTITRPKM